MALPIPQNGFLSFRNSFRNVEAINLKYLKLHGTADLNIVFKNYLESDI